jgi:hypothetical protein
MAHYSIEHTCGHSSRVSLTGTYASRERELARLADGPCPDCRRAEAQERRAAESSQASAQAQAQGLPQLVGSPRQIAWAESIRAGLLPLLQAAGERLLAASAGHEAEAARILAGIAAIRACTSAHAWIEARDGSPASVRGLGVAADDAQLLVPVLAWALARQGARS